MSYVVRLKRVVDGTEVDCEINLPWTEGSLFWWENGNMACDCNRELYFDRALGRKHDALEALCGDERYVLVSITVDGANVPFEERTD